MYYWAKYGICVEVLENEIAVLKDLMSDEKIDLDEEYVNVLEHLEKAVDYIKLYEECIEDR